MKRIRRSKAAVSNRRPTDRSVSTLFATSRDLVQHPVDHAALFYLDDDDLGRSVSALAVNTLEAGGGVVLLATSRHRRYLRRHLKQHGIDISSFKKRNRLAELDGDETLSNCVGEAHLDLERLGLLLGWTISAIKQASPAPSPRIFVYGELVDLLWTRRDFSNLRTIELLGDKLGENVSMVCGYAIQEFAQPETEDAFIQVCSMHSCIFPPAAYPSLAVQKRLTKALSRLTPQTHP